PDQADDVKHLRITGAEDGAPTAAAIKSTSVRASPRQPLLARARTASFMYQGCTSAAARQRPI
ncbi:MAG: hypothetical protein V3V06_05885, partial [Dehalococcoidia bacterium]